MADFEGYQFSADGNYLLSLEGPLITATGYVSVPLRMDQSLARPTRGHVLDDRTSGRDLRGGGLFATVPRIARC